MRKITKINLDPPRFAKRLWQNFKRYVKYAPEETIAFLLIHTYS